MKTAPSRSPAKNPIDILAHLENLMRLAMDVSIMQDEDDQPILINGRIVKATVDGEEAHQLELLLDQCLPLVHHVVESTIRSQLSDEALGKTRISRLFPQ